MPGLHVQSLGKKQKALGFSSRFWRFGGFRLQGFRAFMVLDTAPCARFTLNPFWSCSGFRFLGEI